jgi:hypothetical protein
MATKTSTSRALVDISKLYAKHAAAQAAVEKAVGGAGIISFKGGLLLNGDRIKGDEMTAIIVDAVHSNQHYGGTYNPNATVPPDCYAFGLDDDEMAPHKASAKPQAATCKECPLNVMGTAETGRGKACKNIRLIALIDPTSISSAKKLQDTDLIKASIPVTSVLNYGKYVHRLAALERPTWSMITRITRVEDDNVQFKVMFNEESEIDLKQELIEPMIKKLAEARELLTQPFPEAAAPQPKGRKTAQRAPAKQATAAAIAKVNARAAKPAAEPAPKTGKGKPAPGKGPWD